MSYSKSLTISAIVALAAITFITPQAHAATIEILTPKITQGQTFIAAFDEAPERVTVNGAAVLAFPYQTGWRVVVPIALTAKIGSQQLIAQFKTGSITRTFNVTRLIPNVIVLPVPPKLNQTPKQLVQNLATTNQSIGTLVQRITSNTLFNSTFALPLADNRKISSQFGEVRQTGDQRINHLGADFVMPKGSLVAAINAGIVTKAYVDATYGNSVVVDHGRGIYTLYLHLDSMRVKTGAVVKKGTIVGTLGESGLASAPHLHLSVKINGVSVDPLQFVASFK